ncbi:MAG TPA: glutamine--fructose-6-phosphate transaminase (isomerizing) [Acidobacteriaceae bacterium]|nr:glutamine--fructose-6-phosphate transaminase (isomerizing) [Acidobacteriaceae bacterium]
MCGIVGYVGKRKDVVPVIIEGLRRLEYRGYDSAGIAVGGNGHGLQLRRAPGKLGRLEEVLRERPLEGTYGIGHTRWATHGRPTEENAHPHRDCTGGIVVVHNGIVENYLALKQELLAQGHKFATETDTEIIAHLIEQELATAAGAGKKLSLEDAVRRTVHRLTGAFAISVLSADEPNKIVAARNGPPAIIGVGDGEYFVASDVPGILHHTRDLYFLADGDMAVLTPEGVTLTDFDGNPIERPLQRILWDPIQAEKGGYKHFMLKEIFEQPRAIRDTTLGRISLDTGKVFLAEMKLPEDSFRQARNIHIAACGTSWHAATAGKFMIERLARMPVEVDYASEFRYRDPILDQRTIGLLITQSGETADTLAAQREMIAKGSPTVAVCNVVGSMITREAHGTIYTHAGPEIGVASTKAFTAQLVALFLFAVHLAQVRGTISAEDSRSLLEALSLLPGKVEDVLRVVDDQCEPLARLYSTARDFLFLGRGIHYPIALEGALKLKEISYIHAEGYPAGEMKHGPNALIDETLPVVVLATKDESNRDSVLRYEKTLSNIQEVTARSGKVIAVATHGDEHIGQLVDHVLFVPPAPELLLPVLDVIPLQLLAYHIAVRRGCDVDQPRNLAKSVTVE